MSNDEKSNKRPVWRLSVVEELSALVTANLQRASRLSQSIWQREFEGN